MPQLGVNIDHVATVRQARRGTLPDPVEAAVIAEQAGCDSIVCHLREDRRHIQDGDLRRLKETVRAPLNLEMSVAEDVVAQAVAVRSRQGTLVPERRAELTTEGGLDLLRHGDRVAEVTRTLSAAGIAVSVFVDPDRAQLTRAKELGVPIVELHTGRYAEAGGSRELLDELRAAAEYAHALGLRVNAGHGLEYANVAAGAGGPDNGE